MKKARIPPNSSKTPNITNVNRYPTWTYTREPRVGPSASPIPVAASAWPRYFSFSSANSMVIMEKPIRERRQFIKQK